MTAPLDPASDKFRDECGVFGIFGHAEAAPHTALGLHALQHRGQEACGIVSYDGKHFHAHRALGEVGDNFSSEEVIQRLRGHAAIGVLEVSAEFDPVGPDVPIGVSLVHEHA